MQETQNHPTYTIYHEQEDAGFSGAIKINQQLTKEAEEAMARIRAQEEARAKLPLIQRLYNRLREII